MKSEMKIYKDYVLGKQNIVVDIFKDTWDNHVEIKSSGKCCNRQKSWTECDGTNENENSPTMNIWKTIKVSTSIDLTLFYNNSLNLKVLFVILKLKDYYYTTKFESKKLSFKELWNVWKQQHTLPLFLLKQRSTTDMTQHASQLNNSSRKEPAVKNTENKEGCICCEKWQEAKLVPILGNNRCQIPENKIDRIRQNVGNWVSKGYLKQTQV